MGVMSSRWITKSNFDPGTEKKRIIEEKRMNFEAFIVSMRLWMKKDWFSSNTSLLR